jgi:hypothetical protein
MRNDFIVLMLLQDFLEGKKTIFTSPSWRATPPRQPPLPLCGRSCRNQLLPPRISPPMARAATKNMVFRFRCSVDKQAWVWIVGVCVRVSTSARPLRQLGRGRAARPSKKRGSGEVDAERGGLPFKQTPRLGPIGAKSNVEEPYIALVARNTYRLERCLWLVEGRHHRRSPEHLSEQVSAAR